MSTEASASALERLFRRFLLIYPAWWRAQHGEAMIGTLLDVSDETSTRMKWTQVAGMLIGGLTARVDTVIPPEARSLAARASLLLGTGFCAAYFLFHSWAPWADTQTVFGNGYRSFDGLVNGGAAFCALWFLSLIAYLLGMARSGRLLMVLTLLSLLIVGVTARDTWFGPWFVNLWFVALLGVCVILGNPLPPSGRKLAMTLASVGSIAVFIGGFAAAGGLATTYQPDSFFWLTVFPPILSASTILLAGATSLVLMISRHRTGAVSIAIATVPWLVMSTYLALQHRLDIFPLVPKLLLAAALCEFAIVAIWATVSSNGKRRSTYIPALR